MPFRGGGGQPCCARCRLDGPGLGVSTKPLVGPTKNDGPQRLEDFWRAENFGDLDVHWVELIVDTRNPEVFRVVPLVLRGFLAGLEAQTA